jgi:hypothetical protein
MNPSFELVVPQGDIFDAAKYWESIDSTKDGYYYASSALPFQNVPYCDYGFQYARTGESFALTVFYGEVRGYMRNRLKTTLTPNKVYCLKYYVVNTNNNPYAVDSYGALAANSSIDTIKNCMTPLHYLSPQVQTATGIFITDTLNWTAISGTFTAAGDEKYLVLGNFKSTASTNTIMLNATYSIVETSDNYIDDVSLIEQDLPAYAGQDISLAPGDSTYIGRPSDPELDPSCQWFRLPNDSVAIDTSSGIWVKPSALTTYVVRQQLWCSGVKWDTVTVHLNTVGRQEDVSAEELRVFPNPANKQIQVSWTGRLSLTAVQLYNGLGQKIVAERTTIGANELTIDTSELSAGVYWIRFGEGLITKRFVVQQ